MTWNTVTLEELTEPERSITYGVVKPGDHDVDEGVLFVRGGDIRDGRIAIEELRTITMRVSEQYRRTLLRGGELLVSLVGNPGAVAMVPASLVGANIARQAGLVALRNGVNHKYVEFFLRSRQGQAAMGLYVKGSVQRVINLGDLKKVEVPLPPLPTQQRIAAILSAYDDLIENNTRRVAILEEMARSLYEEWFIHFRFPGYQEAEFDETDLGLVPSGWPVVRLDEVVQISPKTTVPSVGLKPFVPMGSLSESCMVIQPIEERGGNSGTKFQNDDTLLARISPCLENGKTGFVDFLSDEQPVAFGSTEYIVMRPHILGRCAIYCLARSHAFRDVAIKSMSGAEGRQRVRPESVQRFAIPRPPEDLLDRFERFSAPIFAQVSAIAKKNTNLRNQRDLLLPKLVSGEINVSAGEASLEAAE